MSIKRQLARKGKPTRKQDQQASVKAFKQLAETHKAQQLMVEIYLKAYRFAVATYFGTDLPSALREAMEKGITEQIQASAQSGQDVDLRPFLEKLVGDFKAAEGAEPLADAAADLAQSDLLAQTEAEFARVMEAGGGEEE